MNYKYIIKMLGNVLGVEGILMILPIIIGCIYREPFMNNIFSFIMVSIVCITICALTQFIKVDSKKILPRASFIIVTFSWLLMSLFGCLPFVISKEIPNFFDAFFEMCSGFTTTGASILVDIESLQHSTLFWRSFSHWIGGMGVIVFILAILPDSKEGSSLHILRAESPGPQVGRLTSKMGASARILYLIYLVLTVIQFLLLWLGPDNKVDAFAAMTLTFGTAGTGGFSIFNDSIASCAPYTQYVISIFMILFGTNFTIFYLLILRKFKSVLKNEELRIYYLIVALAVTFISLDLVIQFKDISGQRYYSGEEAFRHSLFQVASIISTTGYSTVDYSIWPTASITILILLTFTGACAGSTCGGMKLSRIIILSKSMWRRIKRMIHPGKYEVIKDSGNLVDENVITDTQSYASLYLMLLAVVTLLISFDNFDILSNFTAALSCISNVGPGLGIVGPSGNFSQYSSFSKLILSFLMIAGRLELFPFVALFSYRTWKSK